MRTARGPITSFDSCCETGLWIGHHSGPVVQPSWLTPPEAAPCMQIRHMPLACDDANNCPHHLTLLWGVMTNIVGISLV